VGMIARDQTQRHVWTADVRTRREIGCLMPLNVFTELHIHRLEEPGSSVSTVSDYGLNGRGSLPDRGRGFSL
jgi:hypothetical protein